MSPGHQSRCAAHYSIELDDEITRPHRRYLEAVADSIASGEAEALIESRPAFRGLLRDYREKSAWYLQQLRDELSGTARALQETLESLAQSILRWKLHTHEGAGGSRLHRLAVAAADFGPTFPRDDQQPSRG